MFYIKIYNAIKLNLPLILIRVNLYFYRKYIFTGNYNNYYYMRVIIIKNKYDGALHVCNKHY